LEWPGTTASFSSANGICRITLLAFLRDALRIALAEDMPPARREIVYATSEAIRELATASA
jgi:hypothetical protein